MCLRNVTRCAVIAALFVAGVQPGQAQTLQLRRVGSGFNQPMLVTARPGEDRVLFVVQRNGGIRILDRCTGDINQEPYLFIADTDTQGCGGLQSMAFHPDFAVNGKFYVYTTVDNGGVMIDGGVSPFSSHIREYTQLNANNADQGSLVEVFQWVQPQPDHNGGWIGFNPRVTPGQPQYLYITSGDGGKLDDPDNNAQTIVNEPLGKILRIDVNSDGFPADPLKNYVVPASNPFVGTNGDDEIWAYGLRNPFRAGFDRLTGDFYLGDVGENSREEVDLLPATSPGGDNFAWARREGAISHLGGASQPGDVEPIYDYPHGTGAFEGNSVTGGFVYRGSVQSVYGKYLFGDFTSGNLWKFDPADAYTSIVRLTDTITVVGGSFRNISGFGEDGMGNPYLVDFDGEIYMFESDPPSCVDISCLVPCISGPGVAVNSNCARFDADLDSDVDLIDYAEQTVSTPGPNLADCASGPGAVFGLPCNRFDADADLDVDLADYAAIMLSTSPAN